jgi:hypothetical protein
LLLLKGFGIERFMPAVERAEETAAAMQCIGEAPLQFSIVVERAERFGQFHAAGEAGLNYFRAALDNGVGGALRGESDRFAFGNMGIEQYGEHGGEIALQSFMPPGQVEMQPIGYGAEQHA